MASFVKQSTKLFKNLFNYGVMETPNTQKLVVITGCDSGLGYSLSLRCSQLGLTVVSGCLNLESEGAKLLKEHCHICSLDVTNLKSVRSLFEKIALMTKDGKYRLHAVVNNAGVMIFGEFEWYTDRQIQQQIEVNMMGYFRIAKVFLPLLRQHKGRLINITSHCALSNLPALTVYGATKAAIQSWTDGLRVEQKKYGVKVISFIPGSFASQSNIMSAQEYHSQEMSNSFTSDDRRFFNNYFQEFNLYLRHVAGENKPLKPLDDDKLYKKFEKALLSINPDPLYKNEPLRYFVYYNAFRITPFWLRDYLVEKFMNFPRFKVK